METILFDGLTPQKYIWVSPTGSDLGTGSEGSPLKTIQAAVNIATAGTAIMVTAGEYHENIKLPTNAAGTPDNPIWLMSADGPQAAKIVAVSQTVSTIYGFGTDNYVVSGFEIEGGFRGIQFSQSGSAFTNMVNNIVVEGNYIHDTKEDGIKVGQATNAYVVGNTITNVVEEGIDFLAVINGVIAYNEVSYANSTAAGIFAKGGSTGVLIENNYVHDIPFGDGISIGGQTETQFFRPGYTTYEAKDVLVTGNYVEDVARRPVNVKGALDSQIIDNYLVGNPTYYAAIAIQGGSASATPLMYSANIEVADNILVGNQKVVIHAGSNNNISIHDNAATGQWTTTTGPDAYFVTQPEPPSPTNAVPVIVSATATGGATEWADNSTNETANAPHAASGSVVYSDANALDLHTASFAPKGTGYLGTFSLNTAAIDSSDTVGWSFTVADSAIGYLNAGETKSQLYDVTINDGHGGTVTKTVTITLTGASDVAATNATPVIVSATTTGQVTEWADKSTNETANTAHAASGSIIYSDANALDLHTASVAPKGTGYLGTFSLNTAAIDSADTLNWLFTVSDSAIDGLKAGKTKVQSYDVTISDGHGGAVTQTITITLVGEGDTGSTSTRTVRVRSNDPNNAQDYGTPLNSEEGRHNDRFDVGYTVPDAHHAGSDFATVLGVHLYGSDYLQG